MKPLLLRLSLVLVPLLAFSPPLRAAESAPTVDSILEKFVTASGGKAAMEKITSRSLKGDLEVMGNSGATNWQMLAKAPNKQFSQADISGFGILLDGFDGSVAWAKSPNADLRLKEGEELAKVKRDAEFHRDLKLKTILPSLAYKGTDKVDGEEVHVLEAKPSASSSERLSFSVKSGLLMRQESEFDGAQGKVNSTIRFEDFRAVDGVKYAYVRKYKLGFGGQEFEFSIKLVEVRHNLTIEDAKFTKPAS